MANLKRLSGAKDVAQDDFSNGVGTYVVKFDAPPMVKLADVKKEMSRYTLEKVEVKVTAPVAQRKDKYIAGAFLLANPDGEDHLKTVADNIKAKKRVMILVGTLSEGDKGVQTLTLSKVEVPEKKK